MAGNNADVTGRQISFRCCFTFYIYLIVEFYIGNCTEVTAVFHTVIKSCNSLTAYGNTVNRGSGYVISTGSCLNGYRRTISCIHYDRTVRTINCNGRTVSTINSHRTIGSTFVAKRNSIAQTNSNFTVSGRSRNITVTGNLNCFAKVLFYSCTAIISQAKTTGCISTGTVGNSSHCIAYGFELIFSRCTTGYDVRICYIPSRIV